MRRCSPCWRAAAARHRGPGGTGAPAARPRRQSSRPGALRGSFGVERGLLAVPGSRVSWARPSRRAAVARRPGPRVGPSPVEESPSPLTTTCRGTHHLRRSVRTLFGAAACSLALVDDEGEELRYVAADGVGADEIPGCPLPVGRVASAAGPRCPASRSRCVTWPPMRASRATSPSRPTTCPRSSWPRPCSRPPARSWESCPCSTRTPTSRADGPCPCSAPWPR